MGKVWPVMPSLHVKFLEGIKLHWLFHAGFGEIRFLKWRDVINSNSWFLAILKRFSEGLPLINQPNIFFLKIKKDFRDCRQITFALHNRFCPLSENPPTSLLLMGYSRKKPNRGLRIWKFQGIKKMTCGISRGLGFWSWNFQVILHNFVKFPWVELCFPWNFQE